MKKLLAFFLFVVFYVISGFAALAGEAWVNDALQDVRWFAKPEVVRIGTLDYSKPMPELLAQAGWYAVAYDCEPTLAVVDWTAAVKVRCKTAQELADEEAARQAQAEAQAYAVVAAAGPTVAALQRNLVLCGYSIPISPAEVMADFMRRDALGELSVEQQLAMPKIFMLHRALTDEAGLSNEQIVAVWNAIKPEE